MKDQLTKTAYLNYLTCPNEFWLSYQSDEPKKKANTMEYEHLRQQGYEVERYVKLLQRFQSNDKMSVDFQRVLQTNYLYARSDAVITDKVTGIIDIYEIKSSSSVKPEHLDDVVFQRIVAERCAFTVGRCYVITLNSEYVRRGAIDAEQLFKINDVTDQIELLLPVTVLQIEAAIAFADSKPIPSLADYCGEKLNCEYLKLHFQDLPDYTVFNISRINKTKLKDLLERGIINIRDVPDDYKLSDKQQIHVTAAKTGEPYIDRNGIAERMATWQYPLHFLDYETFSYAIPQFDGIRPFQQMCFQYSLHTIREKGGEMEHKYFLAHTEIDPPRSLAAALYEHMAGDLGTVLVWYEAFEKTRNDEMAAMFPEFAEFFADINAHTYDLMKIFSDNLYVHPEFKGSSSIKKVLPVLLPDLSYKNLGIGDGMTASISWYRAAKWESMEEKERRQIFQNLEKYCEMDTLAMVEIFNKLCSL